MSGYPRGIMAAYASGEMTRAQFESRLAAWQRGRGMEMRDVPESEVVRQVKAVVRQTGLRLQRINTGCFTVGEGRNRRYIRTAEAGTLDFEGYDNRGRFCAIECKRPSGGRLSPAQKERIADIRRRGGVAFVAHGGEEALQKLRAHGCI